jgi:hypothetical protein
MKEKVSQGKSSINLAHTGDHHQAELEVNPETKHVKGGILYNFGDNAAALLTADPEGRFEGKFAHTGDNHGLLVGLKSDGTYEGKFVEKKANLEVSLKGGIAEGKKLPEVSVAQEGDHHSAELSVDSKGKLSGVFESKIKQAPFKVEVKNGKVSGTLGLKGNQHETQIELRSDGTWAASYINKGRDSNWTVSIENGKGSAAFQRRF